MHRARWPGCVRRRSRSRLSAAGLVIVLASLAGLHASGAKQTSAWVDHVYTIDGSDDDWKGLTAPAGKGHVALGFANDGDWLYVCLLARHDATSRQIASTGLIVWLDAEKGKKNAFGIRFPSARSTAGPSGGRDGERASGPIEIDVLGPGRNKSRTVVLGQSGGIQVRATMHEDVFVFELKVPLRQSDFHPYAIGVEPGQIVRATFETPEYRGPYPRGPSFPGGAVGVTIGGTGTAVAGGVVGGIPVGAMPMIASPLSVQTTVQLATR